LQFDSVEDSVYRKLRGRELLREKRLAIEHCAGHGIGVVLVPTIVPGVNTGQIGPIIEFAFQELPAIRGVHFQPVSYFGRYPSPPGDEDRITIPEIITEIETQTGGRIRAEHFKPPGCENALCSFHGNFVLLNDGTLRPWTQHQSKDCGCKPVFAAEGAIKARRFVTRFWSRPEEMLAPSICGQGQSLGGWDGFLNRAGTHSLCISGMAFQDAWNLDLDRLKDCCIHVVHPDGRLIPFCAYNITDSGGRSYYRDNGSGLSRRGKGSTGEAA
ncbi:MAG: radical SAM protein, partial [Syntrophobacteraceae bacterium]